MTALIPDAISMTTALILIGSSFFTSAIMAAAGVGGGIVMLALMASLLPAAVLIPVHGLVQLGSNAGRTFIRRKDVAWTMLPAFLIGSIIGAAIGGSLVTVLDEGLFRIAIGLFILASAWLPIPAPRGGQRMAVLGIGGAVMTFLTMFFGTTGPFIGALLRPMLDDRRALVGTVATFMSVQHTLKVLVFGLLGFAFGPWLPLIAAMVATGFLGTIAGSALLNRLPEATFRIVFKTLITVLALDLIRRGALVVLDG